MDSKANTIAPHTPPHLQAFIFKCRQIIGSPQAIPALIAAVKHTKDVTQGIAMYVMGLVMHGQKALGPLNPKELRVVLAHLAGTIIELVEHAAKTAPQSIPPQAVQLAQDKKKFFQLVLAHCLALVNHAAAQAAQIHAQPPQGPQGAPGAPPQGGPPQGPPGSQGPPPMPPGSVLNAMQGNVPSKGVGSVNFLEAPNQ